MVAPGSEQTRTLSLIKYMEEHFPGGGVSTAVELFATDAALGFRETHLSGMTPPPFPSICPEVLVLFSSCFVCLF